MSLVQSNWSISTGGHQAPPEPIIDKIFDKHLVSRLRVLYSDGTSLYGANKNVIVRSDDGGRSWSSIAEVDLPLPTLAASKLRITERLVRAEIYKLQIAGDHFVALSRGGVYVGAINSGELHLSYRVREGSRPVSLCVGPYGEVYFGEYYSNANRDPVRIFCTRDFKTWQVAFEFPAKEIRHIHGIFFDIYDPGFWILTGDFGNEPGIVRANLDFSKVHFVQRGNQNVRAVSVACRPQGLVFASDTELAPNGIYTMNRDGSALTKVHPLEASSFHIGTFGEWLFFATACEPTTVNDSQNVHIWATRDCIRFTKFATYQKDAFPFLFQYGTVFFPEGKTTTLPSIIYSGSSLIGLDCATLFVSLEEFRSVIGENSHTHAANC